MVAERRSDPPQALHSDPVAGVAPLGGERVGPPDAGPRSQRVPTGGGTAHRYRVGVHSPALTAALASQLPTTFSVPLGTPEGLPTGSDWSALKIIAVFAGIPLGGMVVIIALVVLQSHGLRRRSAAASSEAFSGPYAGGLDVDDSAPSRGDGPATETGEDSGMHREVSQPEPESGADEQGREDPSGAGPTGDPTTTDDSTGDPTTTAGSVRAGDRTGARAAGGSGAGW